MGKKHRKQRYAGAGPQGYGPGYQGYGPQGYQGHGPQAHDPQGYGGYGEAPPQGPWPPYGADPGFAGPPPRQPESPHGGGYGAPGATPPGWDSLLQGLPAFLRSGQSEQFLLGVLLGAGAAWILSDEELRSKLAKAVIKLYAGVAGGFEELKEQMADIRAEVDAEQHGE